MHQYYDPLKCLVSESRFFHVLVFRQSLFSTKDTKGTKNLMFILLGPESLFFHVLTVQVYHFRAWF
jgi:hypothetical protein